MPEMKIGQAEEKNKSKPFYVVFMLKKYKTGS